MVSVLKNAQEMIMRETNEKTAGVAEDLELPHSSTGENLTEDIAHSSPGVTKDKLVIKNKKLTSPVSADEILPLLIYVVVKAAPPQLYSNVEFISAFRHPSRLVSEDLYCFTQFSSAVAFLLNLTSSSQLSIGSEEFKILTQEDDYGPFENISADTTTSEIDIAYTCHMIDNIKMSYENLEELNDLKIRDVSLLFSEYLEMCRVLKHSRKLLSKFQPTLDK